MNILQTESSLNWGGQEYRTLLEHQFLNEKTSHSSYFVCDPNSRIVDKAKEMKIGRLVTVPLRKVANIFSVLKIISLVKKYKIDVLHAHGSRDALLSLGVSLLGVKIVRSRQITSEIKGFFSYRFLCAHVIASALLIKKMLVDGGVPENKITIVGEGVDLKEYGPKAISNDLISQLQLTGAEAIFINIGMIRGDKGQIYYIEAAKKVLDRFPECYFLLVGEGTGSKSLEIHLREYVKESGLESRILFLGYRDDVADLINLADAVVVASIGVEAQSRIAPQAFSNGKPVISTNAGALTELVVDSVNGFLVQPKDPDGMADAMIRIIEDRGLAHSLGKNGRNYALEHLGFDLMMKKTIAVYENLVIS